MDDKTDLERADAWVTELSMSRRIYGHEKVVESLASLLATVRREERERALEEAARELCGSCRAGNQPIQGMHRYHSCCGNRIRALKVSK